MKAFGKDRGGPFELRQTAGYFFPNDRVGVRAEAKQDAGILRYTARFKFNFIIYISRNTYINVNINQLKTICKPFLPSHLIKLNTVCAGIVAGEQITEYRWSSAHCYLTGTADTLVDPARHPLFAGTEVYGEQERKLYADYLQVPYQEDIVLFRRIN